MNNDTLLLLENLFEGDLNGMVRPVISVDDFESKIDSSALVVAFYSKNFEAAEDLAVFLERSSIKRILDTEVSINTNKEGDHLIFVELDITNIKYNEIADIVIDVIGVASRLIGKDTVWKIKNNRLLGKKLYTFSKDGLEILLKKIYNKD